MRTVARKKERGEEEKRSLAGCAVGGCAKSVEIARNIARTVERSKRPYSKVRAHYFWAIVDDAASPGGPHFFGEGSHRNLSLSLTFSPPNFARHLDFSDFDLAITQAHSFTRKKVDRAPFIRTIYQQQLTVDIIQKKLGFVHKCISRNSNENPTSTTIIRWRPISTKVRALE